MEALRGRLQQAVDPTVVSLATYLLALDQHHDQLATELRKCIIRAEEAELFIQKLHVSLAMTRAQVATAESRETITAEAMREAGQRYTKQLRDAYLVARDQRRMPTPNGQRLPRAPTIPPPTPVEASEVESPLLCTHPNPVKEPQENSREAICLDEVD